MVVMAVCVCVCVDWPPEEQQWLRTARRLLGNVCVTGVTQARQIHRAAVTDTFLAQANLQTHSVPRSPFSHFQAFTLFPLSHSQMLSVSLSLSLASTALLLFPTLSTNILSRVLLSEQLSRKGNLKID